MSANIYQGKQFNPMRYLLAFVSCLAVLNVFIKPSYAIEYGTWTASQNPEKVVEILDEIAMKTLLNAQIQTLQGVCTVHSKHLSSHGFSIQKGKENWDGEPYWNHKEGITRFFIDRTADSRFFSYEHSSTKCFSAKNGKQIIFNIGSNSMIRVITPEHYLEIRPDTGFGPLKEYPNAPVTSGPVGRRLAAINTPRYSNFSGSNFNPMVLFGGGTRPTWEKAQIYSEFIKEKKLSEERLSKTRITCESVEGDDIYKLDLAHGSDIVITHTFSSKNGLNLSRWERRAGEILTETKDFSFGEKDGIIYPNEVVVHWYDRGSGEETSSNHYNIIEMTFNKPIDPEQFTWKAIAPKNGTRIVDEIEKTLRISQDGKLVNPKDYPL